MHNMTGVELIAQERKEQIEKHRWDDSVNTVDELEFAAIYVLTLDKGYYPIKWDNSWRNKVVNKSYGERLKIAGALCAAALDKLNSSK